MNRPTRLNKKKLRQIIQRVVQVAQPDRIILFGSAARGEMTPHSDVDLLVIKSGQYDVSRLTGEIYLSMHGIEQAVDIVLVRPEQIEQYRNTHCIVVAPALRDGKEVYRAPKVPSGRPQGVAEPRAK